MINIFKKDKFYNFPEHIFKNDIYLVSYPRSGNTWTRHILSSIFFPSLPINSLLELQKTIPDIHYQRSYIKPLEYRKGGRIIKSHFPYDGTYKKVIYIYRNPIDVGWSTFKFITETGHKNYDSLSKFVDDFLDGNIYFGEWDKHALQYKNGTREIIYISYEDMVADTLGEIRTIMNFIGFNKDDSILLQAIAASMPEKIKHIANDEFFYDGKIPSFVNSPFGNMSKDKLEFAQKYSKAFIERYKCYNFESKKIIFA